MVCPTSASAAPISSAIGTAPYQNGTITNPVTTVAPTAGSPVATTTPSVPIPSGGANKAMSASGAGLAAALGFAAFFL